MAASGYEEFAGRFAGCTFDGGLYRLHSSASGPRSLELVGEAFPAFERRVWPFGYDWLGRQFALDTARVVEGEPLVLMLEPGTGEILEVPLSLAQFHNELETLREPALAEGFFREWSASNVASLPIGPTECLGYAVPLFLGGKDTLENLEIIDLEVYWSICAQLRNGTLRLSNGAVIKSLSVERG